ncbi:MAG: hypothetical protein ACJ8CQ_03720 [Microvirga sp.]
MTQHQFDAAAELWTARLRSQYPPDRYINNRFAGTTRIVVNRDEVVARGDRTAVVAVDLTEYRSSGDVRHWVGRWDLVLTSRGWLMDEPHF